MTAINLNSMPILYNKSMNQNQYKNILWQELFRFSAEIPINWQLFEGEYDIRKLELNKFTENQLRQLAADFDKKYLKYTQNSKTWMENQYRLFIWFLFYYSRMLSKFPENFNQIDWETVGLCFAKKPIYCQYFFLSSKKLKLKDWKPEQDTFLQKMMKTSLKKKWTEIGIEMFVKSDGEYFRKPKAIRERWLSHLNPDIKKNDWDIEEDLRLIKNVKEEGKKWSKIAKKFGNRSEHTIKNRFNQLCLKYLKQKEEKQSKESKEFLNVDVTESWEIVCIQTGLNNQLKKAECKIQQSTTSLSQNGQQSVKIEQDLSLPKLGPMKVFEPIIVSCTSLKAQQ